MIDIKEIKKNPDVFIQNAQDRNVNVDISRLLKTHEELLEVKKELETLQAQQNTLSGEFQTTADRSALKDKITAIKEKQEPLKVRKIDLEEAYNIEALKVPNYTSPDTPDGLTEEGNVVARLVGTKPHFDFIPKDHVELGKDLDLFDFEAGSRVAGAKSYFLKNELVLLEHALIHFALATAVKHGFSPLSTPVMAREEVQIGSGFNPRGPESQIYNIEGEDLSLIGTSEIAIGGYIKDTVYSEDELPVKLVAVSECFRKEAGAYGRLSTGLYRVHQFKKVEMYQIVHPDKSTEAHEELLALEEEIYQALGIHYQVVNICKGDLGNPAYKKYDLEAWMKFIGEDGGFGEITSASNCLEFQARRLNVKFKDADGKNHFAHTLNGTAVATTRALLAILENFQQADGSVIIPEVLRPLTGFDVIGPKK